MMLNAKLDLSALIKAINQLEESLKYYHSELVQQHPGLIQHMRAAAIQAFEFTYELTWKMMKGNARKFSDLDLLIDVNTQPITLTLMARLLDAFEESDLPFKVDLVDWNTINPDFRARVECERVALI